MNASRAACRNGRCRCSTAFTSGATRRFPWGDDDPSPERANLDQRHLQPAPVGAYPAGASPLAAALNVSAQSIGGNLQGQVLASAARTGPRYLTLLKMPACTSGRRM